MLKPGESVEIVDDLRRQHFNHHVAEQAAAADPIYLPRAAAAYQRQDLVNAKNECREREPSSTLVDAALYRVDRHRNPLILTRLEG